MGESELFRGVLGLLGGRHDEHMPTKIRNNELLIPNYSDLFRNFRLCTNESEVISEFVLGHVSELHNCRILDVGAGSGEIARIIGNRGMAVHCLEPNPVFFSEILHLEGIVADNSTIQDFLPKGRYDLVLAAHLIEAIPPSERRALCEKLKILLSETGRLLLVHNAPESNFNFVLSDSFDHSRIIDRRLTRILLDLEHSGFDVRAHRLATKARFSSFEEFFDFVLFYTEMEESQLLERKRKVREFYLSIPVSSGLKVLEGKLVCLDCRLRTY